MGKYQPTKERYLPDLLNHYLPHLEEKDYYWISPKYHQSFLLKLCGFVTPMNRMVKQEEKDRAFEMIRLLLAEGIDPNISGKSCNGWSPYERSYNWGEIGEKLRKEFKQFGFEEN